MSGREWKPGDAVTATVKGRENVRLVAGWSKYDPQLRWCELSPRWADGDDDECWFMPVQVTDVRPLVVIDPEDRAQVDRLYRALCDHVPKLVTASVPDPEYMAEKWKAGARDSLRSLLAPPRPEEPLGLGAVVEDEDGALWISVTNKGAKDRWQPNNFRDASRRKSYADITVVRILSEGVTE